MHNPFESNLGPGRDPFDRLRAQTWASLARGAVLRVPGAGHLLRRYYAWRLADAQYRRRNLLARAIHESYAKPLDLDQQSQVHRLHSEGLFQTRFEELWRSDFEAFREAALACLARPEIARQIATRRSRMGAKWYVVRAFGLGGEVRLPDPLAEVFLSDRVLAIVNGYLGLAARLHYVDVWNNFPVSAEEPAISSESWHGDHEDRRVVKVFVYLDDVEGQDGPLCFVRQTHEGGALRERCRVRPGQGIGPLEGNVEAFESLGLAELCTGARGTVVVCDSTGLHRGGRSSRNERLVATATYVSDTALDRRSTYSVSPALQDDLGPLARFALRLGRSD